MKKSKGIVKLFRIGEENKIRVVFCFGIADNRIL